MWSWLRRLFSPRKKDPSRLLSASAEESATAPSPGDEDAPDEPDDDPPPWAIELGELLRSPEPPTWAAELGELLQKSTRAQGRLGLRLDEIERKLEGGLDDLRQSVKAVQKGAAAPAAALRWDDLLDAMDLLEQAATAEASSGVAAGLRGVMDRLGRFLSQGNLSRISATGTAPDGSIFRVVGTEQRPGLPEGTITKVVRAAVKNGDRLVREGEVLTNRGAA
jgi:molecular chaperone GrpE (heat shock protein)